MQASSPSAVRTGALALVTGTLFAVGPATVDMSMPSLPAVQAALGTGAIRVELSLTLVFLGLAISQLLVGLVADRYGRRPLLLAGMAIYTVAAAAAALSPGLLAFCMARLAQALGYGMAIVLVRSAVADVCDERGTAKVFSTAITIMSIGSVVAPVFGGFLLDHFGSWRAVYFAMGAIGASVLAISALLLPETLPTERRARPPLSGLLDGYLSLLHNRRFLAFAAVGGGAVAYQFTYNTGAPALFIGHFGVAPTTAGLLFGVIALSTALASQFNAFLLRWKSPDTLMRRAVVVAVVAAAALLAVLATGIGGVQATVVALFVLIATLGFIAGNAMAAAIASAGAQAGAASALIGVLQFLCGTLGSAALGLYHDPTGRLMGVVILILSMVTLLASQLTRPGMAASARD